jgi:hypothetical protein
VIAVDGNTLTLAFDKAGETGGGFVPHPMNHFPARGD